MPLFRRRALVCREAVELMSHYLEDALPRRERARLEAHLRDCPHCSAYLQQLRLTIGALGSVEPEALSQEALDALVKVYRRYVAG